VNSAAPQALPPICSGVGLRNHFGPAAPPDHLLLIAVGVVAGVGFGVLPDVIRFGFGVLAR